jgi:hypothetical protein
VQVRRKKEEGRGKKEEGRGKREEGTSFLIFARTLTSGLLFS